MSKDCKFKFLPMLPTAEAYKNKEFSDYSNTAALFEALKSWESIKKYNLEGYIYFNEGYESNYEDGTMKIYNNPKWWESGAKSCFRGCCTKAPEGYLIGTVVKHEPRQHWAKKWQEFRRVSGPGGLEEQFSLIEQKEGVHTIWIRQIGWFRVLVV